MELDLANCHLDRQRYAVQRIETAAEWSYPEHAHRGFGEIFYLASGRIAHRLEGADHLLGAGALVLVREGDSHRLRGQGLRYFNLNVPVADFARSAAFLDRGERLAALLAGRGAVAAEVPPGERRAVEDLFVRLFDLQLGPAGGAAYQAALVDLCARFIADPAPAEPAAGPPAWLAGVLEEASAALAEASPAWMARRAGVSAAHLARTMRRHGGETPARWLNRCRLERAALRLTHTNEAVADICFDLGFAHLGWFYRLFRRAHGCAPAAYRGRYRSI
ncbi:MAG: AraC family transcriptional regulator [Planctomycetes bacterium]|nr:AraC family transcriptional regulator [Planctomycetota bacterium]